MDAKVDFIRLGLKSQNSSQCTCFDFHEVALFNVCAEAKDRKSGFKTVPKSFVGKDTVSRLVQSGTRDRLAAVCKIYLNFCGESELIF
jgi:hypothetical protein